MCQNGADFYRLCSKYFSGMSLYNDVLFDKEIKERLWALSIWITQFPGSPKCKFALASSKKDKISSYQISCLCFHNWICIAHRRSIASALSWTALRKFKRDLETLKYLYLFQEMPTGWYTRHWHYGPLKKFMFKFHYHFEKWINHETISCDNCYAKYSNSSTGQKSPRFSCETS